MELIPNERFSVQLDSQQVDVNPISYPSMQVFHVTIGGQSFAICRAKADAGGKFWTCIPENQSRHQLAQSIGPLIESYYLSKKN